MVGLQRHDFAVRGAAPGILLDNGFFTTGDPADRFYSLADGDHVAGAGIVGLAYMTGVQITDSDEGLNRIIDKGEIACRGQIADQDRFALRVKGLTDNGG